MSGNIPKPSWVSSLLIKTKIPDRTIGMVGTLLTIGTIPITVVLALLTSKSPSEELNVIAVAALLFGFVGVIIVYYLLRETFSIQNAFITVSRERDSAIQHHSALKDKHDLLIEKEARQRMSFANVAPAFNSLSRILSRFDAQAVAYNNYIVAGLSQANLDLKPYVLERGEEEDWWKALEAAYFELLSGLCDTAVQVISLKKGGAHQDFSANIKTILGVNSSNNFYKALRRSGLSRDERGLEDESLKKKPILVTKNRMYHHILIKRRTTPWCLVHSLEEYLKESNTLRELEIDYPEPNENALRFYKSCIVVPITGEKVSSHPTHRDVGMEFNEDTDVLLGFFCIDSSAHLFDEEYDLQIMKQLANHASSTIRTFFLIEKVRGALKQNVATPPA